MHWAKEQKDDARTLTSPAQGPSQDGHTEREQHLAGEDRPSTGFYDKHEIRITPNTTATVEKHNEPENDKPAVEKAGLSATVATEDFTVFTVWQRRWIILAGSFASCFSPMSGSIYFPALSKIADDLDVSESKISITVTTYLIVQGLAPMMVAGFSDKAGRRPAYMLCFSIYIIANLALALQDNFIALLILRMLQSAGSSGTVALAQGLVGDLITSAERGQYVAWSSLGVFIGPTLSPVIGGLISQYLDWHWLFWFLLILSCVSAVPFFLFLPETCRNIVGDGSVPPPWTSWNLTDHARHKARRRRGIEVDEVKMAALRKNISITFPNPLSTLRILADPETALILLATGLGMACYYAISTGASPAFSTVYGFDELEVGLIFIAIGVGSIVSAFTTGKLVDWNYRRHAKRLGFPLTKNRKIDLSNFPLERARLELGLPCLVFSAATVIGYGFMMDHKISIAGPIITLILMGYALVASFQILNVLTVDLWSSQAAAATAGNNVIRCLLGAAASAAIIPMAQAMGNGLAYTTLSLIFLISCLGPLASVVYGIPWRKAKKVKQERMAQQNADKRIAHS